MKWGGNFVEMGAFDGLRLSISLFFERHLNWKGLVIGANPVNYELVLKNRPNTKRFGAAAEYNVLWRLGHSFLISLFTDPPTPIFAILE